MDNIITTPAQENYVQAIYHLSQKGPVRPSAVAKTLGVKRASVSKYIGTLVDRGLITHEPRGELILTESGLELAKSILRRERCLTSLLVDVCNMSVEDAEPEVHRLEHLISDEVLLRLETLVEFACSSSGWLKRLHLRMAAEQERFGVHNPVKVGSTKVHQGQRQEESAE
ncbi:MAG: metal-dependent transcriptional regulator [Desulfofustis sp.]|nr:metal-dependent transcriptional regulator [Desulfofustis sp.]NNK58816.1 metal-dependent transcriptional regulator [Desulfofustis sp.]